jgi:hypothetical protein
METDMKLAPRRLGTRLSFASMLTMLPLLWLGTPIDAGAQWCNCDVPDCCINMGTVEVTFSRTFEGGYRTGEPYDVLTIAPNGRGETLEAMGIRVRIRLVCNCTNLPLAGVPAAMMQLFSPAACWCSQGNPASQDTDSEGWTEFHGTLRGGGCANSLLLFVDGVPAATIPIKINSPDSGSGWGCAIDQSDLAAFAAALGVPAQYSICFDYNESGQVDASDLAFFASFLGATCE